MTNLICFIVLIFMLGGHPAKFTKNKEEAKPKSNFELGLKLLNDKSYLSGKPKESFKVIKANIKRYKEAGKTFLADTGLKPQTKMAHQAYALIALSKMNDQLYSSGKMKDILTNASDFAPKIWMETENLPEIVKWDSLKPPVVITVPQYLKYREEYYEPILNAARECKDWKRLQKWGLVYTSIIPDPETKADAIELYKMLNGYYQLAYAAAMAKDAIASRQYGTDFYDFIFKKRHLVEAKGKIQYYANSIDSLYHSSYFNYNDFDDHEKVRIIAAKAFAKLDDQVKAYSLYSEVLNSGSKSAHIMFARLNAAADMKDYDKIEEALRPFDEKQYNGELTPDQEKRIKECKKMLKKEL